MYMAGEDVRDSGPSIYFFARERLREIERERGRDRDRDRDRD